MPVLSVTVANALRYGIGSQAASSRSISIEVQEARSAAFPERVEAGQHPALRIKERVAAQIFPHDRAAHHLLEHGHFAVER